MMKMAGRFLARPGVVVRAARWHLRDLLGLPPEPVIVGMFVTTACANRCRMCTIWRHPVPAQLPADTARKIVDAVSRSAAYLSFSGGEPLSWPPLTEMIAYAASRIPYVHLVTSGRGLTPDLAAGLARAGLAEMSVSIDGNREWHNAVRGSQSSYDEATAAIDLMRVHGRGVRVTVNTVFFPAQPDEAIAAVAYAGARNCAALVQAVNRHFAFPGVDPAEPPVAPDGKYAAGVKRFTDYCRQARHLLNSRYYLDSLNGYFRGDLCCELVRPACRLPDYFLEVNAAGGISPCLQGSGWDGALTLAADARAGQLGAGYADLRRRLRECRNCDRSLYVCYWEPLARFQPRNFLLAWRGKRG